MTDTSKLEALARQLREPMPAFALRNGATVTAIDAVNHTREVIAGLLEAALEDMKAGERCDHENLIHTPSKGRLYAKGYRPCADCGEWIHPECLPT